LPLPTYTRAQNPFLRWRDTDGKDSVTPIDRAIIQIRLLTEIKMTGGPDIIHTLKKSDTGRRNSANLLNRKICIQAKIGIKFRAL
jgi:hypothetical protein